MSSSIDCCSNCCPTVQTLNIPGPQGEQGEPGADGTNGVIAPGALNPEGNVIGIPGQTYLNTTDDSFWIKKSGIDAFGWINLIGGAAIMLLCLFLSTVSANAQAVLRTYFTTNTTPTVATSITNTALVSQTNNYSWSSNNIVSLSTTNATILSFNTNLVRYVSTNAGGVVATYNTNLVKGIVTNSFPLATNKSGLSCVLYAVDQFAITNQWWFTNGVLYVTNRF